MVDEAMKMQVLLRDQQELEAECVSLRAEVAELKRQLAAKDKQHADEIDLL